MKKYYLLLDLVKTAQTAVLPKKTLNCQAFFLC